MKYFVYQLDIDEDSDVYADISLKPSKEFIEGNWNKYKLVCAVEDARSFDHVYEIGNIGPENKITRYSRMRSVSMGDVIISENGIAKFVDRIGFGTLTRLDK